MDEDAKLVSGVTDLKLSMVGDVDVPPVIGGFPKAGLAAYVGKLVPAGYFVAIAARGPILNILRKALV